MRAVESKVAITVEAKKKKGEITTQCEGFMSITKIAMDKFCV